MRLEPCEIGKLVDAFLTDHGGIHVGDQQHLAPMRQRLHDHVEFAMHGIAQDIGPGARVGSGFRGEAYVGRQIAVEPIGRARLRQQSPHVRKLFVAKPGVLRSGDECCDKSGGLGHAGGTGSKERRLLQDAPCAASFAGE